MILRILARRAMALPQRTAFQAWAYEPKRMPILETRFGSGVSKYKVKVIAHQNPSVHALTMASTNLTKPFQKERTTIPGLENYLSTIAASHDVVDGFRINKAKRTSHN